MTSFQFIFLLIFIFLNTISIVLFFLFKNKIIVFLRYRQSPDEELTDRVRMGDRTALALKLKNTSAGTRPTLNDLTGDIKLKFSEFVRIKKRVIKRFLSNKTKGW